MDNQNELKPCPFCGGKAEHKTYRKYRKGYVAVVGCARQQCPATISQATFIGTPEYAFKLAAATWNDRTTIAKPMNEWHEDHGDVLWWTLPVEEPPYCGSPLNSDWPGYHTHWTPIITPRGW